jgi:hypothetical protein
MELMEILKLIIGYFYHLIQVTIHRFWVFFYIRKIIKLHPEYKFSLYKRAFLHDLDKYLLSEAKYFSAIIFKLKNSEYGSKQYKGFLEFLKPVIIKHYELNSHHPEHYINLYQGMSEVDKLEMIADWISATKRHKTGNIYMSLKINQKRFQYSDEDKEWMKEIVETII